MPPLDSYFGSYTINTYAGPEGPLTGLMKEGERLAIAPDGNNQAARLSWGGVLSNSLILPWIPRDGGALLAEPAQLTENGALEVLLRSAGVGMTTLNQQQMVVGELQVSKVGVYLFRATKD